MSIGKRKYTLSEAALAQRRRVSPFAKQKRATEAPASMGLALHVDPSALPPAHEIHASDVYAPLAKDAPNSEHHRRAALIRVHKIRAGELSGSTRGGRRKVSRNCAQCGTACDSAREARDHCRVSRKLIAE